MSDDDTSDETAPSRPEGITPELFLQWRSPVRGETNPQKMTNPVWAWLIESRLNAYQANELFSGPSSMDVGPCWCFTRFGQSSTELPDGRTILIAGEHEDHYDPDFFIYNDVVIVSPNGDVEILGYPPDAFPPTDFHSATLVGQQIIVIGNLGYVNARRGGTTQVLALDLNTWRVSEIRTEGAGPGWLHSHQAQLTEDGRALVITGGMIDRCDGDSLVENIDDWQLTLADWKWERLTTRRWRRFELRRQDKRQLHIWSMRQALWSRSVGWGDAEKWERELEEELGSPARLDIVPSLFRPGVPHEDMGEDPEKYGTHRVRIDGIVVRYVEETFGIQLTVEGELPDDTVNRLREELAVKLDALEQSPIDWREIL